MLLWIFDDNTISSPWTLEIMLIFTKEESDRWLGVNRLSFPFGIKPMLSREQIVAKCNVSIFHIHDNEGKKSKFEKYWMPIKKHSANCIFGSLTKDDFFQNWRWLYLPTGKHDNGLCSKTETKAHMKFPPRVLWKDMLLHQCEFSTDTGKSLHQCGFSTWRIEFPWIKKRWKEDVWNTGAILKTMQKAVSLDP